MGEENRCRWRRNISHHVTKRDEEETRKTRLQTRRLTSSLLMSVRSECPAAMADAIQVSGSTYCEKVEEKYLNLSIHSRKSKRWVCGEFGLHQGTAIRVTGFERAGHVRVAESLACSAITDAAKSRQKTPKLTVSSQQRTNTNTNHNTEQDSITKDCESDSRDRGGHHWYTIGHQQEGGVCPRHEKQAETRQRASFLLRFVDGHVSTRADNSVDRVVVRCVG